MIVHTCEHCKHEQKFEAYVKNQACTKCLKPLFEPKKLTPKRFIPATGHFHTIDPKDGWIPYNAEQLDVKLILESTKLRKSHEKVLELKLKIEERACRDKIATIRGLDKKEGKEEDKKLATNEDEFTGEDY